MRPFKKNIETIPLLLLLLLPNIAAAVVVVIVVVVVVRFLSDVSRWFSPGTPVSYTSYNWLVTT